MFVEKRCLVYDLVFYHIKWERSALIQEMCGDFLAGEYDLCWNRFKFKLERLFNASSNGVICNQTFP